MGKNISSRKFFVRLRLLSKLGPIWSIWEATGNSLFLRPYIFHANVLYREVLISLQSSALVLVISTPPPHPNKKRSFPSQAQMELDWPYILEISISHRQTGLELNPQGKRTVGRPCYLEEVSRRGAELKEANITWNTTKRTAGNRVRWGSIVTALCSTRKVIV